MLAAAAAAAAAAQKMNDDDGGVEEAAAGLNLSQAHISSFVFFDHFNSYAIYLFLSVQ